MAPAGVALRRKMTALTRLAEIERSIHKKFRKSIWRPFVAGVKRYELVQEGDRIAVCISGGKDSFLLAKLMQELRRHSYCPFELRFVAMDPGYGEADLSAIRANAELLEVPVAIFGTDIFSAVRDAGRSPCYLCARMRRGHLYSQARQLGCNKIALGHHMSDVVETTLMGMLFGSQHQIMMPKLRSKNFAPLELVRPMYCVAEDAIVAWAGHNGLRFAGCCCPLKESLESEPGGSKRQEVKELLRQLKRQGNKKVEKSVFNSLHMLNLGTAIGYRKDGVEHSFLEWY